MYFKEYILPLWYLPVSIIFLVYSIYYFLFRLLVARKFQLKKRIEERNYRYLYAFITALILIITSVQSSISIKIFLGIILICQGFWVYDYNFFLDEGLFIKGRLIPWSKISNLGYKSSKVMVLSYFKNNPDSKISKVTFNIGYNSRLELENILNDKANKNNVENKEKIYETKSIKTGLALALVFLTMIFAYGVYNLLQPKSLGVILEKTFNHGETTSIIVYYPLETKNNDIPIRNMSTTSKEEKIKEVKDYLNSFHISRIQFKDVEYRFTLADAYKIVFYELNGNKVEVFISKKEPIIEIIINNKKKSYFIKEGYKGLDFIDKFGESID